MISIYLVFAAGLFDFLDGFAARLLSAYSDTGKSLDSLADLVSFGVLPGVLVYYTLITNPGSLPGFLPFLAILIPVFSAIRLAIFNNDPDQKWSFRGLPTPSNAFLVTSSAYIHLTEQYPSNITSPALLAIGLIGCFLMVSSLKMFSLKFNPQDKNAFYKTGIFILLAGILIVLFRVKGMFFTILLYIAFSFLPTRIPEKAGK